MHHDIESVLLSEEQIQRRVQRIGKQIEEDYCDVVDDGIILVSVLRGAAMFMSDLARAINLPLMMDYMCVSSYGKSTTSTHTLTIKKDMDEDVRGKHVIIVEDVVDSGYTLSLLRPMLLERGAKSVEVATLLHKWENQYEVSVRYIGYDCPPEFIVGYGLDYAERYRNLPYIGVLKKEVYEGVAAS